MDRNLIDEALANPKVKALFAEVDGVTPIDIVQSDQGNWGSITKDGRTKISTAPTERPSATLAHELLHAKLKNSGYRQYLVGYSMNENQQLLTDIIAALDN